MLYLNNVRARRFTVTSISAIGLLLGLMAPTDTASAAPTHHVKSVATPPAAVSTKAEILSCQPAIGFTTLTGYAKEWDGTVMNRRRVFLYLHSPIRPLVLRPVAVALTTPRGHLIWKVRHNIPLANYALTHHGMLNLDAVNVYRTFANRYSRPITVPYCMRGRHLGILHLMRTPSTVIHRGKDGKFDLDQFPPNEYDSSRAVTPVVMSKVEGAKGITTSVGFSTDRSVSVTGGYGFPGSGWSLGGSITASGSAGSMASGSWQTGTPVGLVYYRNILVRRLRVCVAFPPAWGEISCTYVATAAFTGGGDYYYANVAYNKCSSVPAQNVIRWARTEKYHLNDYSKSHGATFAAKASAAAFGWTLSTTTTYGTGSRQRYVFHRTGPNIQNYYCIGGSNGTWDNASRVVVGSSVHPG